MDMHMSLTTTKFQEILLSSFTGVKLTNCFSNISFWPNLYHYIQHYTPTTRCVGYKYAVLANLITMLVINQEINHYNKPSWLKSWWFPHLWLSVSQSVAIFYAIPCLYRETSYWTNKVFKNLWHVPLINWKLMPVNWWEIM